MRNAAILVAFSASALLVLPAVGQDRPNLSGTWQFDNAKSNLRTPKAAAATWLISEDADSIQITQSEDGASKTLQLKCSTDGKDCKIKGEKGTASFWYNGSTLVEMENKGDHVMRYRMKLSDDGKTLTVDSTSIVPPSTQDDVLVFRKQA